jgi:hypothetical protein
MATTTNFGWTTPNDTDLVKDGAAAIRTLGNGIDTSFLDLKGGTTNQVLAKNSGTDLDFKWVTDATGMANPMTTTGDTIYSSSGSTPARLGIGTTGQVLTVSGGIPAWATPASVAPNGYTLLNTGGTTLTGATTVTYSGISGQRSLLIRIQGASSVNASAYIGIRVNTDSGANYDVGFIELAAAANTFNNATGSTEIWLGRMSNNAGATVGGSVWMDGTNTTSFKALTAQGFSSTGGGSGELGYVHGGIYKGTSAITSVSAVSNTGNFDAGTLFVYGAAI